MKPTFPTTAAGKSTYGKNAKGQAAPGTSSKTKQRLAMVGSALLLLLITWFAWPNSQVGKVRQMQQELFSTPRDQLSAEERKQKFDDLRAERDKLSPEEIKQLRQEKGKLFQQKMNEQATKYLAMSPVERLQVIDDRLAREQAMQVKRAQAGSNGANGGPGGGKGGPGGPGGPTGPGATGGPNGPRAASTPEERDAKRREGLLRLTPMARAGMDQMRLDTATRRAELGLPPSTGRGFGKRGP